MVNRLFVNTMFNLLLFVFIIFSCNCEEYDRFSGKTVKLAVEKGDKPKDALESFCTIPVKSCTPHEGSRIDGTCNNFQHPVRGTARGPYLRLLPPDYANNKEIRKDKHGDLLPSARRVRTSLQTTGRVDQSVFTIAAYTMMKFIQLDISYLNDTDFLHGKSDCCSKEGEADPQCIPINIPEDDPYLKVTDIRCLNATRVDTFQNRGCVKDTKTPEQINYQTPVIDLSTIYGVDDEGLSPIRTGEYGMLKLEKRGDRYVPLNLTDGSKVCLRNKDNAKICYGFGFPEAGNFGLRVTTFNIFFMREHNRIATILHKINPCWKDDRLFKVARQINIATAANIFLYELLPLFLGYKNMEVNNLVSDNSNHIHMYDDKELVSIYAEFEIAMRYFHTLLDGRVKLYSENYSYHGEWSYSDTMFKQGLIELNKNFEAINRGTFFQRSGKNDDIQDPDISENYYGNLQKAADLPTLDIQRGRDLGIRGYNDYRHFCGLKPAKTFEDLLDAMDIEKLEALKHLYKEVDDIDLLAGINSEKFLQGALVGPTLFCFIAKQMYTLKYSDRFWYERGDQVHSFSLDQLNEIRKTNIARLACDNAEGIKSMQPNAFVNVMKGNDPTPCSHIIGADLNKWRDDSCYSKTTDSKPRPYSISLVNFYPYQNSSTFFKDFFFKPVSFH